MARYTGSFTLAVTNNPNLRQAMIEVLKTCGLELVYDRREYIMAREIPGKVALSKLVAIVFEGVEGCGKTTAIGRSHHWLQTTFPQAKVIVTREPGDTQLGLELRQILLEYLGK
jgi:signal recognition particle GTPase